MGCSGFFFFLGESVRAVLHLAVYKGCRYPHAPKGTLLFVFPPGRW